MFAGGAKGAGGIVNSRDSKRGFLCFERKREPLDEGNSDDDDDDDDLLWT
jgi:hypothetical protein